MTDDWPSHHQELTRKTADQVKIWGDRFDAGTAPLSTWIAVLSTLWHTTSGLIDEDVSRMISDLHRDALVEAQARLLSERK